MTFRLKLKEGVYASCWKATGQRHVQPSIG